MLRFAKIYIFVRLLPQMCVLSKVLRIYVVDFLCTLSHVILTEISLKEYSVSQDERRHALYMQEKVVC